MIIKLLSLLVVLFSLSVGVSESFVDAAPPCHTHERDDGKIICVSESTATKLMERGWELTKIVDIINDNPVEIDSKISVNNYNKDYLKILDTINSETNENAFSTSSVYSPGWSKTEISKIPKLGDIFEITATAQADPPTIQSHHVTFLITEQFEFVKDSLPENVLIRDPVGPYFDRWTVDIFTDDVKTVNVTVQVKAIKEGYGFVYGGARYANTQGGPLIYVDKDNSFYYNDGDEPTVNYLPPPDYGLSYADTVALTQQNSGVPDGAAASSFPSNESDKIIPEYTTQQVEELGLSRINWADHMDDKSFYEVMPQAKNVKTTIVTPQTISVGSIGIVKVTLESINRSNDYEHVLIDTKFGPGIELDVQKIDVPNCLGSCGQIDDVYNNDIFAIGLNNSTTIDYPIKATKTGTWMLNFVVNGEFERYKIIVE